MARTMKMKIKKKDNGIVEVLCLVNHPMETGLRKDKKTKKLIPAHHIQKMIFDVNGKTAADVSLAGSISKNPLIGVHVKANPGDTVKVSWSDNKGETGSAEKKVS